MVKKISLAVMLVAMAGIASAGGTSHSRCTKILWNRFLCPAGPKPGTVSAPEIDPASAMAGLTLLAGGLAVLRGRRKKISIE